MSAEPKMPKEYAAMKEGFKKAHPDWSDERVSGAAAATFYKTFNIAVNEAHKLEADGKWAEWKKAHGFEHKKFDGIDDLIKAMELPDFHVYADIDKVDHELRMVYGYATNEALDSQGERVMFDATKDALDDYSKWRNIREMHQEKAVGVAPLLELRTTPTKGLYVGAKIIDDDAWKKVQAGVYKGFSIGGKKIESKPVFNKELSKYENHITKYRLTEISIVDRPANPSATFEMVKRFTTEDLVVKPEAKTMDEEKKVEEPQIDLSKRVAELEEQLKKANECTAELMKTADELKKKFEESAKREEDFKKREEDFQKKEDAKALILELVNELKEKDMTKKHSVVDDKDAQAEKLEKFQKVVKEMSLGELAVAAGMWGNKK